MKRIRVSAGSYDVKEGQKRILNERERREGMMNGRKIGK